MSPSHDDRAVTPSLRRFGTGSHGVVVIDDFNDNLPAIVALAAALAPFPVGVGYYPGVRRVITETDAAAYAYAVSVLTDAATFIGGAFDYDRVDWLEASFSMVTTPPEALLPAQRAPHFDSTDPAYIALLHYLIDTPGTAFFRQRTTGIEQVDAGNVGKFVAHARTAAAHAKGYIHQSDPDYEQIGFVEGKANRLIIYRGALLHSGIIPPGAKFSDDPLHGRLTANLFVLGH